jgi:Cu2+-exporting ATPase
MPTVLETGVGVAVAATVATAELSRDAACAHCGLAVAREDGESDAGRRFCCAGCRTAFALLHEHGLAAYYSQPGRTTAPVRANDRSFAEFDDAEFHARYVERSGERDARTTLVLEGVHCASCVWVVERLPLLVSGVHRAELDMRRAELSVEWMPGVVALSRIARTLASLGYAPHPRRGASAQDARRRDERAALLRIGVAGAIAINVMLAALAMYAGWLGNGLEAQYERYFRWLSFALVTPALIGPGAVFFRGAWSALRAKALHLDLPIALALTAGYLRGAVNTWRDHGPVYFDGVALLIFLLLIGRYLQQRWQRAAMDASELLYSLTPRTCRVVDEPGGTVQDVPAAALLPGMLLDVRAGDTFAADGVVEHGESTTSLAWLTGEAAPVRIGPASEAFAGTLNLSSPVRVRVRATGEATRVGRVLRQAEESAQRRAPIVLIANRLAGAFVAVILLLAVVTYAVWFPRDPARALDHAIALLVVTCPCALAMATPLSVTVALGKAAGRGIFIRGGDALQILAERGQLFVDKTGTLTLGTLAVASWEGDVAVQPLVLALESGSAHPIATAFRAAWPGVTPPAVTESEHVLGAGVRGMVDGKDVVVGSPTFVSRELGIAPPAAPAIAGGPPSSRSRELGIGSGLAVDAGGHTPVWIAVDGVLEGRAALGDVTRPQAAEVLAALDQRGWEPTLLSGDAPGAAARVGHEVSLPAERVIAGASPEEKMRIIEAAKRRGGAVVMVGDGVNDAAALCAASVGIAVHGGAEAALASADVYLTTPGLEPVVELVDGARRTMRLVRRNIAFSLLYNAAGIAAAMSGQLSPLLAAILMPLSSITVVASAWLGTTFRKAA